MLAFKGLELYNNVFCIYTKVMAQDDTATFEWNYASFSAFTYVQSLLRIHEVPPLQ